MHHNCLYLSDCFVVALLAMTRFVSFYETICLETFEMLFKGLGSGFLKKKQPEAAPTVTRPRERSTEKP